MQRPMEPESRPFDTWRQTQKNGSQTASFWSRAYFCESVQCQSPNRLFTIEPVQSREFQPCLIGSNFRLSNPFPWLQPRAGSRHPAGPAGLEASPVFSSQVWETAGPEGLCKTTQRSSMQNGPCFQERDQKGNPSHCTCGLVNLWVMFTVFGRNPYVQCTGV